MFGIFWSIKYHIDDIIKYFRFHKKEDKYDPFYDYKDRTYRCFFIDRPDEEGDVEYIVSEYLNSGLSYHYMKGWKLCHEHSFSNVLEDIVDCNGYQITIPDEYKKDYSQQELDLIYDYIAKVEIV